jgi:hypothetical protein
MGVGGTTTREEDNFGRRLEVLRKERLGIVAPMSAAINLYGDRDDPTAREHRKQFVNYLLRVERQNISIGRTVKSRIATALGFASLSAFEHAIEHVFDASNSLLPRPAVQHNAPIPRAASEADRATHPASVPLDLLAIERVALGHAEQLAAAVEGIAGSARVIADALDRLSQRLGAGQSVDRAPRPAPARRGRPPRKGARKTA